jgi:CelD/BcsL family acetyltransferase involved in cellulose biosynthesis
LRQVGNVVFRHLESRGEIKSRLPEFYLQHIGRRALVGDESLFCRAESRTFYEALVDELDPEHELRFAVVELDGRTIAFHFGFECNGKFVWYKPAFDVDLRHYSPGEVLLRELFEYAGHRGLREFDFTVGGEAFKRRFANRTRHNHTMFLYPRTFRGRIGRLACQAKGQLKKHSRMFPWSLPR